MKHNKNADTFSFLLLFTTGQLEKNIEKTFCECRPSKKMKNSRFWTTLPQYLPKTKSKFPVKFIFT